jgi:protein-tyrosine sulfotransferase
MSWPAFSGCPENLTHAKASASKVRIVKGEHTAMTNDLATWTAPRAARARAETRVRPEADGPVVVLTYAHSGVGQLHTVLDAHPALACISGAGLVQLCGHIVESWLQVEQPQAGRLSPLARTATKAMFSAVLTAHLARGGNARWCDTAPGSASMAEKFLELYPNAAFISLHRQCADMVHSGLRSCPWGLTGYGFGPFAVAHPGNSVAALANYWATHTEAILGFEEAHPGQCHRVRYEDLAANPEKVAGALFAFLGLEPVPGSLSGCVRDDPVWAHADGSINGAGIHDGGGMVGEGRNVPIKSIPPALLSRVNDLLAKLAYTLLGSNTRSQR